MMRDGDALEVCGVCKSYDGGDNMAIDRLDLSIARGETYALLGPNGAGKTTAVEIMEGHRSADAGSVRVLGFDPSDPSSRSKLLQSVGIVLQELGLERYLRVREVLDQHAEFYESSRDVGKLMADLGLEGYSTTRVSRLSGGLKRRVDVAVALVGSPALLFLDEPTTGFDPRARRELWGVLEHLKSEGLTIVLTTHDMFEAETLAERIGILVNGKLVAEGTSDELRRSAANSPTIRVRLPSLDERCAGGFPLEHAVSLGEGWWEAPTDDATASLHRLTSWAVRSGVPIGSLRFESPTLEAVYLSLTQHAARPAE